MVAVTYGVARVARTSAKAADKATPHKSLFVRFIGALAESRIRAAEREIERHAHLLPGRAKDTPFGGW
jgi:hypothetical protein